MDCQRPAFIALFTDFGIGSPYLGQLHALFAKGLPAVPVVDLLNDAPTFQPRPASYLLKALCSRMPRDGVYIAVVDPGVGSERRPLLVSTAEGLFVGPDNGLLVGIVRAAGTSARLWRIPTPAHVISDSFHGRDLFAPAAIAWCLGQVSGWESVVPEALVGWSWPDDLAEVIYVDSFGNLMTGIAADGIPNEATFEVAGARLHYARTFSEATPGAAFWYRNSIGLVECAVNQGQAESTLSARVGTVVCRLAD